MPIASTQASDPAPPPRKQSTSHLRTVAAGAAAALRIADSEKRSISANATGRLRGDWRTDVVI
jgi:hypothetical protein